MTAISKKDMAMQNGRMPYSDVLPGTAYLWNVGGGVEMARDFIFATTLDRCAVIKAANSVSDRVIPGNRDNINCYSDNSAVLLTPCDPGTDINDFRDALVLFDVYPISVPVENFFIWYCQLHGDISFANRFFMEMPDLMIMINFPNIILGQALVPELRKNRHYDWYGKEERLAIAPV